MAARPGLRSRSGGIAWCAAAAAAAMVPLTGALMLFSAPPAHAASGKDPGAEALELAGKVLHRQKGLPEARAVELLGAPAARAAKDDATTLAWGRSGEACVMTAEFRAGALAAVTFATPAAWDKKACRARARPLLDAAPAPGSPAALAAPAASLTTLTNGSIVDMVKEGRPAQAIIARIRTEPCRFDVSTEATLALRRDGVGEAVIQAMIDRDCR